MKKVLIGILVISVLFVLTACGEEKYDYNQWNNGSSTSTSTSSSSSTASTSSTNESTSTNSNVSSSSNEQEQPVAKVSNESFANLAKESSHTNPVGIGDVTKFNLYNSDKNSSDFDLSSPSVADPVYVKLLTKFGTPQDALDLVKEYNKEQYFDFSKLKEEVEGQEWRLAFMQLDLKDFGISSTGGLNIESYVTGYIMSENAKYSSDSGLKVDGNLQKSQTLIKSWDSNKYYKTGDIANFYILYTVPTGYQEDDIVLALGTSADGLQAFLKLPKAN